MPKAHRGSQIRSLEKQGRGKCPVCSRSGIKLLYERELTEGNKTQVCKQCNSSLNKKARA